jgi:hypothetical protein
MDIDMVMDGNFKLSKDDIDIENQDALDLFYAGIKANQTKTTMDRLLKKFLLEVCVDILHGNYRQRAEEFVNLAIYKIQYHFKRERVNHT